MTTEDTTTADLIRASLKQHGNVANLCAHVKLLEAAAIKCLNEVDRLVAVNAEITKEYKLALDLLKRAKNMLYENRISRWGS